MGVVVAATHEQLDQRVALIVPPAGARSNARRPALHARGARRGELPQRARRPRPRRRRSPRRARRTWSWSTSTASDLAQMLAARGPLPPEEAVGYVLRRARRSPRRTARHRPPRSQAGEPLLARARAARRWSRCSTSASRSCPTRLRTRPATAGLPRTQTSSERPTTCRPSSSSPLRMWTRAPTCGPSGSSFSSFSRTGSPSTGKACPSW